MVSAVSAWEESIRLPTKSYILPQNPHFVLQFVVSMKRRRTDNNRTKYAIFEDIKFPRANPLADYDTRWNTNFNDRTLITVTQS